MKSGKMLHRTPLQGETMLEVTNNNDDKDISNHKDNDDYNSNITASVRFRIAA